jgi:lysozyme
MRINAETIALIKHFEGCKLTAYRDPVGVWTIGYGLTTGALPGVSVGAGMTIAQEQADDYLTQVLTRFSEKILPGFTRKPTENQFGAFLSLAYNIGFGGFLKSTALRRFNAGDDQGAVEALQWFNKAGGKVLPGLVRRRAAEAALFMRGAPQSDVEAERPDQERGLTQSTTLQAASATAVATATSAVTAISALDGTAQLIAIVSAVVAALGIAWMMRERIRKWAQGDR